MHGEFFLNFSFRVISLLNGPKTRVCSRSKRIPGVSTKRYPLGNCYLNPLPGGRHRTPNSSQLRLGVIPKIRENVSVLRFILPDNGVQSMVFVPGTKPNTQSALKGFGFDEIVPQSHSRGSGKCVHFKIFLTREWLAERGFLPWYGSIHQIISEKDWFRPNVPQSHSRVVGKPLQHCDLLEKQNS